MSTLKVLIAGFGRFPGAPVNPSGLVASRLGLRRRPALAATHRITHVFATRYASVDRDLPALLEREAPDIVLLFGVATRARRLRIEELARNRMSVLFPDAGGTHPTRLTIAPGRPALRNPRPIERLVRAAGSTGVPAARSRNAGTYLCNYIYWRALEAARRPAGPTLVAFVHVPPIRIKPRPAGERRHPTWGLGELVRAGEAILVAMTALAREQRAATLVPRPEQMVSSRHDVMKQSHDLILRSRAPKSGLPDFGTS
jgi:pyroglutamyl-peptidase